MPDARYPLRLVEADLTKAETWPNAVRHCTYVLHVASPLFVGASDDEIVRTAVEGTTNVLQACADVGGVKRVVMTSSTVAVSSGFIGNPGNPPDYVYTEKDWSDATICVGYNRSKLKAEQAAWDFHKKLDDSKRFELAVVNPSYVQGSLLSASSGDVSREICLQLLNGAMPALPDAAFAMVDAGDTAAAHIAVMKNSGADGKRYIVSNRTVHLREYAQIIAREFGPQGYNIVSRTVPNVLVWVGKFFNNTLKELYPCLGKSVQYSNERMVSELGIHPRPIEESIIDLCYSLIDLRLAKKTPGYLGRPSTRDQQASEQ